MFQDFTLITNPLFHVLTGFIGTFVYGFQHSYKTRVPSADDDPGLSVGIHNYIDQYTLPIVQDIPCE